MKITFTDYQEWLDELKYICENDADIRPDLVRLSKEKVPSEDGNGHKLNEIILCGSFVYDGLPYEVFVECGEQYISINAGSGDKVYSDIESEVREYCSGLDMPVRKGRLVLEL